MGRHSSPERTPFLRSLGAWALPWLLIAAVLAIALVVAFDMVGNDPVRTGSDGDSVAVVETPGQETGAGQEHNGGEADGPKSDDEAAPDPAEKDHSENGAGSKEDSKEREKADRGDAPKLITEGIEVQVLNGTADAAADDLMADRLARLGYSVVAVSPSSKGYAETVVFWTGDAERIGEVLAERFDWDLAPAPTNLSSEVHLHVMVGEDAL